MNLAPPGHLTTKGTTTGIRKAQENHHSRTSAFAEMENDLTRGGSDRRRVRTTKVRSQHFQVRSQQRQMRPRASKRDGRTVMR